MAVSKKIIDLTTLALKDRVLTLKERQVIVNAALNEGTSEKEVNMFLDNMLTQRLKSFTKEELCSCPTCGHGVPLIADECPYCGTLLEHQEPDRQSPPKYKITNQEAAEIESENIRTAEEKKHSCPKCGAPYPLISNICGYCGYVLHEVSESDLNIKNLIANIQASIARLKSAPKPTFLDVVKFRLQVVLILTAALLLVLAFTHSSLTLAGWSGMLLIAAIVALFITKKEDSPVTKADNAYYDALYTHEMFTRTVNSIYGENAEARQLLENYAKTISEIKQTKDSNRKKLVVTFIALILAGVISPFVGFSPEKKYKDNRAEYAEIYKMSEWHKTVSPDKNSPIDDIFSPYFKCEGRGVVSIDVENDLGDPNSFYLLTDERNYRLRISGIRLVSTGKQLTKADTSRIALRLKDKDGKILETGLKTIALEPVDYDEKCDDNLFSVLERGEGSYYADFVSKEYCQDIMGLHEIAAQIESFMIVNE
ncbi:MAG: zinc ribbon domain-containing protein [Bacteroidales bacterium]|nr:zinc ribbon domain-containing protein [Bacteroidales bacterium]